MGDDKFRPRPSSTDAALRNRQFFDHVLYRPGAIMLRYSALIRAALRAPKQDVAQVTRTLSQLSIHAQSSPLGQLFGNSTRTFATKTATRTRKPAAKKTTGTSKKGTTKKTTTKKKPTSRRSTKTKPKPKAKPRKRVLSEKGKAVLEKKKALASLRDLKAIALIEPKGKPDSAWTVYVSEKLGGKGGGTVTEGIKTASSEYKSLSASEREHYNHIANENKAANQAAYSEWVASYTPEQIRKANNARKQLKRKGATPQGKKPSGKGLSPIQDDRQIKRPNSAYLKFSIERRESGDFKGISLGESAKLITEEWNKMSAGDKKKYEDLHQADKERYLREFERTYGHPPPSAKTKA